MSTSSDLENARTALTTSIQKWEKKFNGETNTEMIDLISKVHELEGSDYSNVKVKKGIKYGEDERQRLDVSEPGSPTLELLWSYFNLQRKGKQTERRGF